MYTSMNDNRWNRLVLSNHIPPVAAVGDEASETPAQASERRWRESEIRLARRFTLNFALRVIALLVLAGGLWYVGARVASAIDGVKAVISAR